MMSKYTSEFKAKIAKKLLNPQAQSISQVIAETGVSKSALYKWKDSYLKRHPGLNSISKSALNTDQKLNAIIETASMNEQSKSEYCRTNGIYPDDIKRWKSEAFQGNASDNEKQISQQLTKIQQDNQGLKKQLLRKDKALAEAAALLILQKKLPSHLGGRRGIMITQSNRQMPLKLIEEARQAGARLYKACEVIGITTRTYNRWVLQTKATNTCYDKRKESCQSRHYPHKLTEFERQQILSICNQKKYENLSPSQVVPKLADEGIYIASESSFYRILKAYNQLKHRGKTKPKVARNKPDGFKATQGNQVWSWDITYLPSQIKGHYYYLYLIEDIFSRKIIHWDIHDTEDSEHASQLIQQVYIKEQVQPKQIVLHSDNGSPMKGSSMLATLQRLGVFASFSRPSVSNDNPYSESLFKTLKYCPHYPKKPFVNLEQARTWMNEFEAWYNHEHLHSSLKYVTPHQRHLGLDKEILSHRAQVYKEAKLKHPARWSGDTRNWDSQDEVWLNPPKYIKDNAKNSLVA
ncbi:MAG: IS3 family transposase [Mesoflavibacter sp.]|nr:IS3 family transposase [Mesoflavibacter sp.]